MTTADMPPARDSGIVRIEDEMRHGLLADELTPNDRALLTRSGRLEGDTLALRLRAAREAAADPVSAVRRVARGAVARGWFGAGVGPATNGPERPTRALAVLDAEDRLWEVREDPDATHLVPLSSERPVAAAMITLPPTKDAPPC